MIRVLIGDITDAHTDVIVNAANGIGVLGGGVAGSILRVGGIEIQNEARKICRKPKEAGECYVTGPGDLAANDVKYIYHAVTMKYPGGYTSLNIISKAIKSVFDQLLLDDVESVAMTALGTGVGTLEHSQVANIMTKYAKKYDNIFDIYFIDKNENFINEVNKILNNDIAGQ
ncbi:MAG TPA: macro domain-containing protein [Candidatus Glassbacteria bacterium]|nr:macro domain-containing protein [Candidatus Glassbacteria bacterium]